MFKPTSPCDRAGRFGGWASHNLLRAFAAVIAASLPLHLIAGTDISSVPLPTYAVGSSVDIKPNIMMVLDDSGSMSWNYLPDWANDVPPGYSSLPNYYFMAAQFNGVAYNPAITYSPPIKFNTNGTKDTSTYPSMDGTTAPSGANTGQPLPNWQAVKNDGFGVQAAGTSNITSGANYYVLVAGEYCDSPALRNCTTASAPTGNYAYPAPLRWCDTNALTNCGALNNATFNVPRAPAPRIATITVSAATGAVVSGITLAGSGAQIMSAATAANSTTATVAQLIRNAINACTNVKTGNCTTVGYSASVTGSTVTIYAPSAAATTFTISSTGATTTTTAFARNTIPLPSWSNGGAVSSSTVPGDNYYVVITPTVTSYPYPGTNAKAATRTDCAGSTCTYNEEMTNFANWFAYYRTRMQMMKTSSSRAFASLDTDADIAAGKTRYRVGYMSINNNTGSDFVNINDFDATQKVAWYAKFLAARPNNSTPLRQALSNAGRLYGGKLTGTTFNGTTVTDPLQYSCQRNYTILSTDGFWNGNAGYKLDGSTAVGNQDLAMPRPYNDGGSTQAQTKTSQLQTATVTQIAKIGTLQTQTAQLQMQTLQIQKRTQTLQSRTQQIQQQTQQVQQQTQQIQQRTQTLQKQTSTDHVTWTGWSNTNSCTQKTNGGGTWTRCQTLDTGFVNAASCTPGNPSTGVFVSCQTTNTGWVNAASCSPSSAGGQTISCQTTSTGWVNASSCTPSSGAGQTITCQTTDTGWVTGAVCNASGPTNGKTVTCQTLDTGSVSAPSCAASNSGGVTVTCPAPVVVSAWADTASACTAGTNGSGVVTQCRYAAWSGWSNAAASCTAQAQSAGPSYSVVVARQCQYSVTATQVATQVCTPAAPGTYPGPYTSGTFANLTVYSNCTTQQTAWTNVASCTATSTYDASGNKTACQYTAWSPSWSNVTSCVAAAQSTAPNYTVGVARQCQTITAGGTSDTLADVAAYYYNTDLRSPTAVAPDATGTCVGPIIAPATTASDLCADNVPPFGRDTSVKQHMTTSTLGLGAQGSMVYSQYQNNLAGQRVYVPDYWQQQSGDFYSVANASTASQASGICEWQTDGTACTWSTPFSDSQNNIDDLWHAAVNGRGTYFSATDPQSLADSLKTALSQIVNTPRPGTAAAAASSNPNITSSDNFVFSSSYKSIEWFGELIMQRLAADGTLGSQQWSAMQNLDCSMTPWQANTAYRAQDAFNRAGACYAVTTDYTSGAAFDASAGGADGPNITAMASTPSTRTIYTVGSTGLVPFTWANLTGTQQAYFSTPYITYVDATTGLTQFCTVGAGCMGAAAQTSASGQKLVEFLAGDRTNEGAYYRLRRHVLGDIVSSEARYVKVPLQGYADTGYSDFKALMVNRAATVYVGANDGMVHAFDALTGRERWGFVPSAILPTMYKLGDTNYASKHTFFVDGTPEVGDICPNSPATCAGSEWKTILVGGLNDGGKAYYALDITNPSAPQLLWEFADSTLGTSYSNPRITKLQDGTWVVILASGYNNIDGVGRLYVLNANTGTLIRTLSTGVGTAANPSGLAKLAARAPTSATNNTVEEIYGGDLLGNVWRFDVNNTIGTSGFDAQLLVTLYDAAGNPQPITSKPTVASVNNLPMIMIGTGKYLGLTDLTDTRTYTMYGFIDRLTGTTTNTTAILPTPRSTNSGWVHQTLVDGTCPANAPASLCNQGQQIRTVTAAPVNWASDNGWYIDFILDGERAVTDPTLALGTLVFTTIKPQSTTSQSVPCSGTDTAVSAVSYLYYLDYLTGGAVAGTNGVVGNYLCTCVATRPSVVRTQAGQVEGIIRTSGGGAAPGSNSTDMGQTSRQDLPYAPGGTALRRVSWRDLNGE